jgi:hypothetical protein
MIAATCSVTIHTLFSESAAANRTLRSIQANHKARYGGETDMAIKAGRTCHRAGNRAALIPSLLSRAAYVIGCHAKFDMSAVADALKQQLLCRFTAAVTDLLHCRQLQTCRGLSR